VPAKTKTKARPVRKARVDAARNRQRLLETAKAVFAKKGASASLEEIARAAQVGIGTLYRHFPARDALIEAMYRHESEQLALAGAQMKRAIAKLTQDAVASGDIRMDMEPHDLLRALGGVMNREPGPDSKRAARRLVDILLAGISTRK
jgi:AcrR family transcriptional regulator